MTYRTIIGLEVHVQLLTKTKLFCGCSTQFGLPPNSATCPVCIGMPGTLPVMNRLAFELSLKAAIALQCTIAPFSKWDRKNYFYPDLPKNYQISQYDLPFSSEGSLEIECSRHAPRDEPPHAEREIYTKRIGILRAHLEEDAGKMLHDEPTKAQGRQSLGPADSLVDLNRTGTPLLEIVSKPDIDTPEEAKAYLEEIRLLLREIGVSDCEMQEGSLRCDANINIHVPQPDGSFIATPIIEVKNLNTIRGVERALKYEAERQAAELQCNLDSGAWQIGTQAMTFREYKILPIVQRKADGQLAVVSKATAGWDERTGRTEIQRRKEEASDYRYFPEPDLVPVTVDAAAVKKVRIELGELPAAQKVRLQSQYGLTGYDAGVLSRQGRAFVAYFEAVVKHCGDAKEACNWTMNDLLSTLNERKLGVKDSPLSPEVLAGLISEIKATGLNKLRAREVYAAMLDGMSAQQAIDKLGFKVVGDESQLLELIRKAIAANPKAVADFKKGKVKAADAIKGFVMRETKGLAKTEVVQALLMQELAKD